MIEIKKLNSNFSFPIEIKNKTYYLKNVIEGELVDYKIVDNNISVTKITKAHPSRIKPICKVYNECGGCSLQHVDYHYQLKLKTELVKNLFLEANLKFPILDCLGMINASHYRNKCQMVYSLDKGKIKSGFFEEYSHNVIDYDECYIQNELANKINKSIKFLIQKLHISVYNEKNDSGFLKHVLIRTSNATKQILVVIVTKDKEFKSKNTFIKTLLSMHKEITTIVQNLNPKKTTKVMGDTDIILFGKGFIIDELCGLKFKISPQSFYQINHDQAEVLYNEAINHSSMSNNDVLLDAYSGIGTIGMVASKHVKKVISVELSKDAVNDALFNKKINDIKNITIFQDDATNFIQNEVRKKEKIDIVILDPPRKGSTPIFLESLLKLEPREIIYISCDPHSLVNDIKSLIPKYQINYIQPIDLFPYTNHVETVVLLTLKNQK